MSKPSVQSEISAILQRAEALPPSEDAFDPQLLAALQDKTIRIGDLSDASLAACQAALGTSGLVDLLLEEEIDEAVDNASPLRISSWWQQPRGWLALAASIAILATVAVAIFHDREPKPALALNWSQPLPKTVGATASSPRAQIAQGLPNFSERVETLGTPDAQRTQWRLATTIIRVDEGFGSGTIINPAGWILTNYHVVSSTVQQACLSGDIGHVQVILAQLNGQQIQPAPAIGATVYRVDPTHDLALLKLDALPPGVTKLPFFPLASTIDFNADCAVVGSQYNGPAWWVREGNISQLFNYPQDLSQYAAGAAGSEQILFDRERLQVIISDMRISPGDSGGPLINAQGQLIGLTYATPANDSAGSVGWHIALPHIRQFLATLPSSPEGAPLDLWTAGLPEADILVPQHLDASTLQYRYAVGKGDARHPVAQIKYIQLNPSAAIPLTSTELPSGLWQMTPGGFQFDLCVLNRSDDVVAIGYATRGQLAEIRIGSVGNTMSKAVWTLDAAGIWRGRAASIAMFDESRFDDAQKQRLAMSLDADGSDHSPPADDANQKQTSEKSR